MALGGVASDDEDQRGLHDIVMEPESPPYLTVRDSPWVAGDWQ